MVMIDSTAPLEAFVQRKIQRAFAPTLVQASSSDSAPIGPVPVVRYIPSEWNVGDGPSRGTTTGAATEPIRAHANRLAPECEAVFTVAKGILISAEVGHDLAEH